MAVGFYWLLLVVAGRCSMLVVVGDCCWLVDLAVESCGWLLAWLVGWLVGVVVVGCCLLLVVVGYSLSVAAGVVVGCWGWFCYWLGGGFGCC